MHHTYNRTWRFSYICVHPFIQPFALILPALASAGTEQNTVRLFDDDDNDVESEERTEMK